MKMLDIHPEKVDVILLMPPMFATADLMNTLLAAPMGDEYRYLIPDLAGHGTAIHQIYKSAAIEAKEIDDYLMKHQIDTITLAFGASLGGVVLMELLRISNISFKHLFFEGLSFQEKGDFVGAMAKFILLRKHKKAIAHPEISVEKMERLYGKQVAKEMAEQMVSLHEESLKHIVWDCSHVQLPVLSLEQQRHCVFAYGEKDGDLKLAKKVQPQKYPAARQSVWSGYKHCTKITEANRDYVQHLKNEIGA